MRVHGVRFVESTLAPVTRGSADAGAVSSAGISSIAYGTVIFGKGFYGVSELDGGIKTFTVTGPTKSDPLAQLDTYGYPISGHIKFSLIDLDAETQTRRKRDKKVSHRERLNEKTTIMWMRQSDLQENKLEEDNRNGYLLGSLKSILTYNALMGQ